MALAVYNFIEKGSFEQVARTCILKFCFIMEDAPLAEVAADRVALAARAPAKFMRYIARAAAVYTLELRDVEDAMDAADALTVASFCLEIGRRRGRPISAANVKKVCFCAIALRIAIEVQLLPRLVSCDPAQPIRRLFDQVNESWCYREVRFQKPQLPRVLAALRLPERCILDNRATVPGQTVLLVSLFTLSYPRTQGGTAKEFGFADQTEISRILAYFRVHVTTTFGNLLQPANDDDEGFAMWARFIRLFQSRIFAVSEHEEYADVAMFTDGTFRPSCRPAQRQEDFDRGLSTQRRVYSGYKKRHGLTFQGTMTPCGLFASMHGAFTGRRADGFVFRCVTLFSFIQLTRCAGTLESMQKLQRWKGLVVFPSRLTWTLHMQWPRTRRKAADTACQSRESVWSGALAWSVRCGLELIGTENCSCT